MDQQQQVLTELAVLKAQLSSDRALILEDAGSGTHRTALEGIFATSSAGADAVIGYGSLELRVP